MGLLRAAFWGAIQGVTEFIPVSSSGHLVVIPRILGVEAPDLRFNIALHIGTLAAVVIYFHKEIAALFTSERRRGALVIAATIPILVCGLLLGKSVEALFDDPVAVGWLLIVNGVVLFIGHMRSLRAAQVLPGRPLGLPRAMAVGVAQSLALLPGISRSGITITAGLFAGLDRKGAYRFSFLLFVPASLMAFLYSVRQASFVNYSFGPDMLTGVLVSAAFGVMALRLLYAMITRARLYILAIYSVALGVLTVSIF
jgi:undecaprenyl-diphosphatase